MTWKTKTASLTSMTQAALLAILTSSAMVQSSHAQQIRVATVADKTVNMLLMDKQGGTIKQYIGKLKGSLAVDGNRRVTGLDGTIVSLEAKGGRPQSITNTELRDGTVVVTTTEGAVYAIYGVNGNLVGNIRLIKPASTAQKQPGKAATMATAATNKREHPSSAAVPGAVHTGRQAHVGNPPASSPEVAANPSASGPDTPPSPKPAAVADHPASGYHVLTGDDGLSCAFSQDLSLSMGYGLSGTMTASANHLKCVNKANKEVEIEIASVEAANGKVAIRTKQFGTVYRGNERGTFSAYEMTDRQIRQLKTFLGLEDLNSPNATTSARKASAPNAGKANHQSVAGAKGAAEARTASPSPKAPVKKRFEDMTALEVAKNPAAYGFKQGGSMAITPTAEGVREGFPSSRDEQWIKESDGKLYILTIHYDDHGKLVSAKWGGF